MVLAGVFAAPVCELEGRVCKSGGRVAEARSRHGRLLSEEYTCSSGPKPACKRLPVFSALRAVCFTMNSPRGWRMQQQQSFECPSPYHAPQEEWHSEAESQHVLRDMAAMPHVGRFGRLSPAAQSPVCSSRRTPSKIANIQTCRHPDEDGSMLRHEISSPRLIFSRHRRAIRHARVIP